MKTETWDTIKDYVSAGCEIMILLSLLACAGLFMLGAHQAIEESQARAYAAQHINDGAK